MGSFEGADDDGWQELVDSGAAYEFGDPEPPDPDYLDWDHAEDGLDEDIRQFLRDSPARLRPSWPAQLVDEVGCGPSSPALWHLLPWSTLIRVANGEALLPRAATNPGWSPADPAIVERRRRTHVEIDPGGVVTDYVPFYLTPDTPFAFHAASRSDPGNPSKNLAFLVVPFERVRHLRWVGSSGNAASGNAYFFNSSAHLGKLDWRSITAPYSERTKAARQAEVLVHGRVPLSCVAAVVFADRPEEWRIKHVAAAMPESQILIRNEIFYSQR